MFDEAITFTRTRTESQAAAKRLADRLHGTDPFPLVYELLHVSPAVFADAVTIFERYDDRALSVTDATSAALVDRHDLDGIPSFDDDFDGVVNRFDLETV